MNLERSLTGRRWILRDGDGRVGLGIAQRLGLPEVIGRLLASRGVDTDLAQHFLEPTLRALLPDPSVLAGMDAAADLSACIDPQRAGAPISEFVLPPAVQVRPRGQR